jgi:hypothetical protein
MRASCQGKQSALAVAILSIPPSRAGREWKNNNLGD